MRYGKSNGWLDGQPAAITRRVGNGRITYIGAWLDAPAMMRAVDWMLADARVRPVSVNVPDGVEFSIRSDDRHEVWFFVNLSAGAQKITLPQPMTDVLHGGNTSQLSLERFEVAVLSSRAP
jgi:beta-galactosidase